LEVILIDKANKGYDFFDVLYLDGLVDGLTVQIVIFQFLFIDMAGIDLQAQHQLMQTIEIQPFITLAISDSHTMQTSANSL
jgi:hypothetical protein